MSTPSNIYWINKSNGNYRCMICGYQYFDGLPRTHVKECRWPARPKKKKKAKEAV